jgi:hypothetical protein
MLKEIDLEKHWPRVEAFFHNLTGKRPDLNGMLFLIGVRELGAGLRTFSKEEKQDLMHIATCKVLSFGGFYELEGLDAEGWPHYKELRKPPFLSLPDQEKFLKMHILEYFNHEVGHL